MIFSLIVSGFYIIVLHTYLKVHELYDISIHQTRGVTFVVIVIAYILVNITHIFLGSVLFVAANKVRLKKSRFCWIGMLVLLIVSIVIICTIFLRSVSRDMAGSLRLGVSIVEILFHLFSIWVVVAFMEEIKEGRGDLHMGVAYTAPYPS